MPKMQIKKSSIDKHMPYTDSGTVDYWDTGDGSVKGFGVRVGMESKTFFVQVEVPSPKSETKKKYKTVKSIIGKYGLFTAEQAREDARERIRRLKQGQDAMTKDAITLRDMLAKHLTLKDFAKTTEAAYNQFPVKFTTWMDMSISDVAELDPEIIVDRFKQIESDNGRTAAMNVFHKLSAIMNHAKILFPKHVFRNPCIILTQGKYWPKIETRTDCLHGNDFKLFYDGIQAFNANTRDAFLFCLFQGLRRMEAASLKWEYVDLEKAILHIPITKNGIPLYVPLSRQSIELLNGRKKVGGFENEAFVFPTFKAHLNKTGHVTLNSVELQRKTKLDLTVHGLRRSFIDIADNKLKLRRQDVDRLTNHVDSSVTGKHYSHKDIEDLRAGIQAIANEIERLMIHGAGAKVIDFPAVRQAA